MNLTDRLQARSEEGWALVTAVALMSIMLLIGFGTVATVDFNTNQTRQLRERESTLSLTEGVLYAQAFTLARNWPMATKPPADWYPETCSSGVATTGKCPNRENLSAANAANVSTAAFNSTDFLANGSWTTRVRDNYGALSGTYNPNAANQTLTGTRGTCAAPCTRDFNGDRSLWVEARATVRGQARKIVALMKLEQIQEGIPRTGITTGALTLGNKGAASYDGTGAPVIVRCVPGSSSAGGECTNFNANDKIKPAPMQQNVGNLMNPDQIERFRDAAKINGTHYEGCPPTLTGAIVFVEYCPAENNAPGREYSPSGSVCATPPSTPSLPSGMPNLCANSISSPGLLIVRCGGIKLTKGVYVGIMYFVNGSDFAGPQCAGTHTTGRDDRGSTTNPNCPKNAQLDATRVVLDVQNGAAVWGAIAADGAACVQLGTNGNNFDFDPNVFGAVKSYGTVGLVQNTWRELPPGAN